MAVENPFYVLIASEGDALVARTVTVLSRIRNVERSWSKVEWRIPHVDVKYQVLRDYVHTYNCTKGHKPLEPSHTHTDAFTCI